jgi:hypothetical protein
MAPRKSAVKPSPKKAQDPADTAAPAPDTKKDDAVKVRQRCLACPAAASSVLGPAQQCASHSELLLRCCLVLCIHANDVASQRPRM